MSENHVLLVIGTDGNITKTIQREEFSVEQLQRALGTGYFERLNGLTSFGNAGKVYMAWLRLRRQEPNDQGPPAEHCRLYDMAEPERGLRKAGDRTGGIHRADR